jgi:hypothetical protein
MFSAMSKPERIKVKEIHRFWDELSGSFNDIKLGFNQYINEGWEGLEYDYEYDYDGSRSTIYNLYKWREETDREYDLRMKKLEKENSVKEAKNERKNKLAKVKEKLSNLTEEELKLLGL